MRIIFAIILTFLSLIPDGQNTAPSPLYSATDDPYIKWIRTIPDGESSSKIGWLEKIFNFITGEEPVELINPVNVCVSGVNNLHIVNQGNGSIVHSDQKEIKILPAFRNKESIFPSIAGLCSFPGGEVLFTDSRLNKVFKLSSDGKTITRLNDVLTLKRPTGIAYSYINDEIWVVETGSHRISILNSRGELKRTLGKRGNGNTEFNFPTYIWIDSTGKIYIVDSMNFRIQVLSSDGDFIISFGKQGNATGSFARPRGIATDSDGNIYVVDALFNAVQIFDISGNLLYYFGSQGRGNYQFWMPSGIFIDKNDYIYISDSYNGRVQIFQTVKNRLQ